MPYVNINEKRYPTNSNRNLKKKKKKEKCEKEKRKQIFLKTKKNPKKKNQKKNKQSNKRAAENMYKTTYLGWRIFRLNIENVLDHDAGVVNKRQEVDVSRGCGQWRNGTGFYAT